MVTSVPVAAQQIKVVSHTENKRIKPKQRKRHLGRDFISTPLDSSSLGGHAKMGQYHSVIVTGHELCTGAQRQLTNMASSC